MMGLFPTVVPLQAAEPGGLDMSFFLVMGIIFLIFYVLVMRPQQRRQREHEAELKAVGKGDRVITTGGLHGRVAEAAGLSTVTLGGGVFQNARLLASVRTLLEASRFRVLVPRRLSPNDGAISYGQAAVAATMLQRRS